MNRFGLVREIFLSIQGEGKYLGHTQCFVRFGSCNLACRYCDTDFETASNMAPSQVVSKVKELAARYKAPMHSVSLTGGEPLFQAPFCKALLYELKQSGFTTYLETNGTLADDFSSVKDYVDIVSMDIKIPSTAGTRNSLQSAHAKFLATAAQSPCDLFAKTVVNQSTTTQEITAVCRQIKENAPGTALFIQPQNTPDSPLCPPGSPWLAPLLENARQILGDVFLIPQMHKVFFAR